MNTKSSSSCDLSYFPKRINPLNKNLEGKMTGDEDEFRGKCGENGDTGTKQLDNGYNLVGG